LEIATTEGIKTEPSLDSMHFGSPSIMVAIFEIDVPKSIPNAFAMLNQLNNEQLASEQ
jgi:hypothetical protein